MTASIAVLLLLSFAAFASGYALWVLVAWTHFGSPKRPSLVEADLLLDRFIPDYDVVERHHVTIAAPADRVFAAASEINLSGLFLVRAIVKARELILGAERDTATRPPGLLAYARSLGWGELAASPGREVVLGAVTRPWESNVEFQPLAPDVFKAFKEPGFVKIVWTLRADPRPDGTCEFRTETRAVATDASARRRFRWYWARFSAGIALIRWLMLRPLKRDVEAQHRQRHTASPLRARG